MPADTLDKTHCPTCGAKLYRQDLSLCAYCGSPLLLGGKIAPPDDETTRRLARMRENPAFPAAITITPVDPDVHASAFRTHNVGWLIAIAGAVMFGIVLWRGGSGEWTSWPALCAIGAVALGVVLVAVASMRVKIDRRRPLLRRPAIVSSRRSETTEKGRNARTVYFFLLRFDDGSEGEFRWAGQGTMNEPYAIGTTGIAYTRANRLVDLRRM